MIATGIILGLILNLACYKYRRLTKFILYFEGANSILVTMIPSPYWLELQLFWIAVTYLLMFLCYYCDSGAQIIYQMFIISLQILVIRTLGYGKTNVMHILSSITVIVMFFILCSLIGVIIVYMKNLEQKKADALKANI